MKPIFELKKQSKDVTIIILTALVFALGINLISSYLVDTIADNQVVLILGAICILIALILTRNIFLDGTVKTLRLRGALFFSSEDGGFETKEIIGYKFNESMNEYLNSFLSENLAYKKAFLNSKTNGVKDNYIFDPNKLDFHNIINSVSELVFLKQLDYHLNTYFVHNEIDTSNIKEVCREHLDSGVLKNRVIDLITKDISEREAFLSDRDTGEDSGRVVYSTGKNGAIYHRLSLELPPESEIRRNDSGFLELESKLFKITYKPDFVGFSTFIPTELTTGESYDSPYLIGIKLIIEVKRGLIITKKDIEMYQWLDSFLEEFEDFVSTDALEKRSNLQLLRLIKESKHM